MNNSLFKVFAYGKNLSVTLFTIHYSLFIKKEAYSHPY